jgi:pyridoxine 5-phosphate synthase
MLQLGVNIDYVAVIRQSRYRGAPAGARPEPDPLLAAAEVEAAGAHGITVHLREDRRHIQDRDVRLLRPRVRTRFNLEMADTPAMVRIATALRPDEVCLVPEKRQEVTTEGGLDVRGAARSLTRTVARLQRAGIAVSLFVDAEPEQLRAAAAVGADLVELHTGCYANAGTKRAAVAELKKLVAGATLAHQLGLRVNAGHGLTYRNVTAMHAVPHLETLNIGHSIISRAVFVGLRRAVREMLALLKP